ncbi:uncharacterized protein Z519_03330 [Cladophialophora bantiana CBS 173.52]|uniref:Uncharacterized protein n=1 Tax=Cladophialophora bantiana (strain ATCC 10958 / CBS 173.52 / CDC B-1940 / NIH 8579) TaxID=1442370 RepID=A0A0D2GCU4_CLAB1|nr:uncharacterized protein Z519_03330 [Cladophialophora bantiana CBS 173.52]KIW96262.1 hypothetical protein Z519_03330 [Cladophialophora bantiana CBS 173.52]
MKVLGWIWEGAEDFSVAEKWFSKAYEMGCVNRGPENPATLVDFHELNRVRVKLKDGESVPEVHSDCDEDVFVELHEGITRLRLQGVEELENLGIPTEPWNVWHKDVPVAKIDTNYPNRETVEETVTPTNKTASENDHQNLHPVDFADSFNSTVPAPGLIWDITNTIGSWNEPGSPAPVQSLESLFPERTLGLLGDDRTGFVSTSLTVADGFGNEAVATFMPEESTFPPSLPASGLDFMTASPYIGTLPLINNDPEFHEFDNAEDVEDDSNIDPTILDPDGNFSSFDLGFFVDVDVQECHAI